jgi:hypothetical protein
MNSTSLWSQRCDELLYFEPSVDAPEAYELVEHGQIDEAQFRSFVFHNPLRLWGGTNLDFFKGTVIEGAAIPSM